MPEVFYKMYRGAGIHFHSTNSWFSILVDVIANPCFVGTCKQLRKTAAASVRCCHGTAKTAVAQIVPQTSVLDIGEQRLVVKLGIAAL